MGNKLDLNYRNLLTDILENGVHKKTRNGETLTVFSREIRHNMRDGFPLLTTKKMYWKGIVTELLWFLRGDTNIKYLVDNGCHIWDGDAYQNYRKKGAHFMGKEEFINKIKTDDDFAKKWGDLGPIYGKQWRKWGESGNHYSNHNDYKEGIDQIANLINDLKHNPDSRRLIVNAWNVGEIDEAVLPPCHYGFQCWTRELSLNEREILWDKKRNGAPIMLVSYSGDEGIHDELDKQNIPRRAITLKWNQRSVDTFLGLPFNIASYGLLLCIIGEIVNMVPEELIGTLGDVHLYKNHIEQAKEQLGVIDIITLRDKHPELKELYEKKCEYLKVQNFCDAARCRNDEKKILENIMRIPYPLPTLVINSEFWAPGTEDGCGMGAGTYSPNIDSLIKSMEIGDFQIENYQSHPPIKADLSN